MELYRKKGMLLSSLLIGVLCLGGIASVANANQPAQTTVTIPATSAAIWQSIDVQLTQLDSVIKNNKMKEVHHHAFAIRDLADALPSHSPNLSADQFLQLKQNLSFVDTLAQRLDESGDANDKNATSNNFAKLQNVLKTIRTIYSVKNKPV